MTVPDDKAQALAIAVHDKAEAALGPMAQIMAREEWPHYARAILWRAISQVAQEFAAKEDRHDAIRR